MYVNCRKIFKWKKIKIFLKIITKYPISGLLHYVNAQTDAECKYFLRMYKLAIFKLMKIFLPSLLLRAISKIMKSNRDIRSQKLF